MNTMKRAHEIRKIAARKFNCKVSEIVFSVCLEMAWEGEKLMKGTEKQIKWAMDIKAQYETAAADLKGKSELMDKALELIFGLDESRFWIDNRIHKLDKPYDYLITMLRRLTGKNGIRYKGNEYSAKVYMDQKTGEITWA